MGYHQYIAALVPGLDLSNNRKGAGGNLNSRLAAGRRRIPCRIGLPAYVVLLVMLPDSVQLLIFPHSITDFPESIPHQHGQAQSVKLRYLKFR